MQELNIERRQSTTESRVIYEGFKASIESDTCTPRQLRNALQREKTITEAQCLKLSLLLNDRFHKRANFDALTQIPNRFSLQSTLDTLIEALNSSEVGGKRLPVKSILVISLDIDEFKMLNDTHGHLVGDEALKTLAIRLEDSVKRADTVFRVGGDEFIILLPITDDNPQLIKSIFERIKKNVNSNLSVSNTHTDIRFSNIPFHISMGFEVLKKGDNVTAHELLDKADKKMYRHKGELKEIAA